MYPVHIGAVPYLIYIVFQLRFDTHNGTSIHQRRERRTGCEHRYVCGATFVKKRLLRCYPIQNFLMTDYTNASFSNTELKGEKPCNFLNIEKAYVRSRCKTNVKLYMITYQYDGVTL